MARPPEPDGVDPDGREPDGPEPGGAPLGAEMPEGVRFVGRGPEAEPRWPSADAPTRADVEACVACGLCLPECPTYGLTGDETASPRGRLAAMRAVSEGRGEVGPAFMRFMDLCLACRACEDVCPSHVPFGRMMEHARTQIEPLRSRRARLLRRLGLDVVLPRNRLLSATVALQPLARPFLPSRVRALVPKATLGGAVSRLTEPVGEARGTVAVLTGCVQDRWFRPVNRATIRVLARSGWRVVVPKGQTCCGALHAHNGRLGTARQLARRNVAAFDGVDRIVVNAAGCGAHMTGYGELLGTEEARAFSTRVRDLMVFLAGEGIEQPSSGASAAPEPVRVAYHDACHALRVQGIHDQPRGVLERIPGLELVEVEGGERCCGAAGLYNITEPEMADTLQRQKAEAVAATGASIVASANPGCSMQIAAGLRRLGANVEVLHPVELLDRAYASEPSTSSA